MAVTPFNQLIILNSLSYSRIYQCFSTTNLRIDTLVKKVLEGFSSPIGYAINQYNFVILEEGQATN